MLCVQIIEKERDKALQRATAAEVASRENGERARSAGEASRDAASKRTQEEHENEVGRVSTIWLDH